jgi:DNA-binding NarL/FixJ family response regulator
MNRCHILIVDDHPIVRHGLAGLLDSQADMEVVGAASSATETLRQLPRTRPDVAIVDISLDGENGIELIEQITALYPTVKTVVSSMHDDTVFAGRALRAGAVGYVNKRESIRCIVDAVRQVMQGEIYLHPHVANHLLHRAAIGQPVDDNPIERLSNRELEVYEMIGKGLTARLIARKLRICPATVETHRKRIKDKLGLRSGAELARHAFRWIEEWSLTVPACDRPTSRD